MKNEDQYFFTLHKFSFEEYEVWRQLCEYEDYTTNITGYTVNQLVVNSDKRANLTTQKVRTILKKFKEAGYIEDIENGKGTKGKETRVRLTMKEKIFNNNQQQSNNYSTNKSEQLQGFEGNEQQQSNNNLTTLSKKKEKNNNIYSLVIDYLNRKANTNYRSSTKNTQSFINARVSEGFTVEDFKKVIDSKSKEWLNTDFEKYLRPATLFGTKFENYLNEANKKGPTAIGPKENNKVNPSICNKNKNYTRGVEML